MDKFEKQIEILSDLVMINNDRVVVYKKTLEVLKGEDSDLKILFNDRINQSTLFRSELISIITRLGGRAPDGTKLTGKIYNVWIDVKAFFYGSDRKIILDNCENGENAALKAYEEALKYEHLTPEQKAIIFRQKAEIKISHAKIKVMKELI